jgi:hypothetical protein
MDKAFFDTHKAMYNGLGNGFIYFDIGKKYRLYINNSSFDFNSYAEYCKIKAPIYWRCTLYNITNNSDLNSAFSDTYDYITYSEAFCLVGEELSRLASVEAFERVIDKLILLSGGNAIINSNSGEAACSLCKKMNDIGVETCWYCGTKII